MDDTQYKEVDSGCDAFSDLHEALQSAPAFPAPILLVIAAAFIVYMNVSNSCNVQYDEVFDYFYGICIFGIFELLVFVFYTRFQFCGHLLGSMIIAAIGMLISQEYLPELLGGDTPTNESPSQVFVIQCAVWLYPCLVLGAFLQRTKRMRLHACLGRMVSNFSWPNTACVGTLIGIRFMTLLPVAYLLCNSVNYGALVVWILVVDFVFVIAARIATIRHVVNACVNPAVGVRGFCRALLNGLLFGRYVGVALRHTPSLALALVQSLPWLLVPASDERRRSLPLTREMRRLTIVAVTLDSSETELSRKVGGSLERFRDVEAEVEGARLLLLSIAPFLVSLVIGFAKLNFGCKMVDSDQLTQVMATLTTIDDLDTLIPFILHMLPFICNIFLAQCFAASAGAYLISVDPELVRSKAPEQFAEVAELTEMTEDNQAI